MKLNEIIKNTRSKINDFGKENLPSFMTYEIQPKQVLATGLILGSLATPAFAEDSMYLEKPFLNISEKYLETHKVEGDSTKINNILNQLDGKYKIESENSSDPLNGSYLYVKDDVLLIPNISIIPYNGNISNDQFLKNLVNSKIDGSGLKEGLEKLPSLIPKEQIMKEVLDEQGNLEYTYLDLNDSIVVGITPNKGITNIVKKLFEQNGTKKCIEISLESNSAIYMMSPTGDDNNTYFEIKKSGLEMDLLYSGVRRGIAGRTYSSPLGDISLSGIEVGGDWKDLRYMQLETKEGNYNLKRVNE